MVSTVDDPLSLAGKYGESGEAHDYQRMIGRYLAIHASRCAWERISRWGRRCIKRCRKQEGWRGVLVLCQQLDKDGESYSNEWYISTPSHHVREEFAATYRRLKRVCVKWNKLTCAIYRTARMGRRKTTSKFSDGTSFHRMLLHLSSQLYPH